MKRIKIIESVFRTLGANSLSDDARMELSKFVFARRYMEQADPDKSLLPLLSFLQDSDAFSIEFCRNYLENFPKFRSQIGQDCFVDTYYGGKREGCFVEIGVGDGYHLSNSRFLEQERGWTGLLVEPCRKFTERLTHERRALTVPLAIHTQSGETVEFVEHVSGNFLSSTHPGQIRPEDKRATYPVGTIAVNDLLDTYLPGRRVDYLSLDIEGRELSIIRSIDLRRFDIGVISVEHNKDEATLRALIGHLVPLGYRYYDNRYFDWDVVFCK